MQKHSYMAFYERRRNKDAIIVKRRDISGCTRHPKHRQAPGVCSLCLHEKLSKICSGSSRSSSSSFSSFARVNKYHDYSSGSSSSVSSLSSSSSGSSMASPVHRYRFDRNALMKSRSNSAIVERRKRCEVANGSVKLGFWSKLISSRRGLKYSKTVRER